MPKSIANNEDVTTDNNQQAFDDIESMSIDELKAALIAARTTKPRKTKQPVVELTPEEEEARDKAIAELEETIADLKAKMAEASSALKILRPRAFIGSNRGPVGVGAFIKALIKEGATNEQIMERVAAEWTANNTNNNCINWYRNDIKRRAKIAEAIANGEETGETESAENAENDMTDYPENMS